MATASSPASRSHRWLHLDPQHAAAVARIVAAARLLFIVAGLLTVVFDPPAHATHVPEFVTGLGVLAVLSAAVLAAAHLAPLAVVRYGLLLHACDILWILVAVALTDGANSPFAAYFIFALLASAFQWHVAATLATGAAAILVVSCAAVVQHEWGIGTHVHVYIVVLQVAAFVLATVFAAWLADKEWAQRLRSLAATRITSAVTAEAGFVASVRTVLETILEELDASRAVLALEEEGASRVFLWTIDRHRPDHVRVELTEGARATFEMYLFALPPAIGALRVRRRDRAVRMLALDRDGIAQPPGRISIEPLMETSFAWHTAICLPDVSGHGWRGRLFVFDPAKGRSRRGDVRFLRAVVCQVGPALFNVYLQGRLQSRTGRAERAALAGAMHDGTLQAIIAARMELELLQRDAAPELSRTARTRLAHVQHLLANQVLEFRDVIQALKHRDLDPSRFLSHLEDVVRRFRDSTGIDARLSCDVDEVDLSAHACRELAGIVREALANVRKHAQASAVTVRLSRDETGWRLRITDNGKGFDFDGTLADDQLERLRRGPALISERVQSIGGGLLVDSRPGHGTTLDISLPRAS